jgi:hypothetical protein
LDICNDANPGDSFSFLLKLDNGSGLVFSPQKNPSNKVSQDPGPVAVSKLLFSPQNSSFIS